MRLLLDTHVFIWWILDDPRLAQRLRGAIADPGNRLYLSAASAWEMVIKAGLGKLVLPEPPEAFIRAQLLSNEIEALPVTIDHAIRLASLPPVHRDPFDRMLVVQSQCEEMTLVTDDPVILRYDVRTL